MSKDKLFLSKHFLTVSSLYGSGQVRYKRCCLTVHGRLCKRQTDLWGFNKKDPGMKVMHWIYKET